MKSVAFVELLLCEMNFFKLKERYVVPSDSNTTMFDILSFKSSEVLYCSYDHMIEHQWRRAVVSKGLLKVSTQ